MAKVMMGKDTLTASSAECYGIFDDERRNFMNAISVEINFERTKTEVPILGRLSKGTKSVGWSGSGTATFHFNNSYFRKKMLEYCKSGKDFYFDLQITNEDPTSSAGRQTIIIRNVNIDSLVLAKFDADGEYLDEEMPFTFDDWDMPEEFNDLEGMV